MFKYTKIKFENTQGFTLIELLVVVAIIGILASVVLASLNSARGKGAEAAIKSNLRNMIDQAELSYDIPGNYSTVCAGVASMLTAIANEGGTAACYTYDNTRWGVSVKLNSDSSKNWSVDSTGVVTWDTADKSSGNWDAANTSCANAGGRLPSPEELVTLYQVYGSTPPSFVNSYYMSNTIVPTNSSNAYNISMINGSVSNDIKTNAKYVRCVH